MSSIKRLFYSRDKVPLVATRNQATFRFENGGEPEMFAASADWMERNFFRRVEIAFPIQRDTHRQRILRDLDLCLRDNMHAWELQSEGGYKRVQRKPDEEPVSVQSELLAAYAAGPSPVFPT